MSLPTDEEIGADFRRYLAFWTSSGRRDDLLELFDEICAGDQSGFPWQAGLEALSRVETRMLWKVFEDEDLQDLHDWAREGGLEGAAKRIQAAVEERPMIDDGKVPAAIKKEVMERAQYRCEYCGKAEDLSIDHKLIPYSEGGSSRDANNLQVLCRSCNSRKGARPYAPPADAKGRAIH